MRVLRENNSIWMGLLIGVTVPVLGYLAVDAIFSILTDMGMMDEVTLGSSGKRLRTMALIGICFNIIPIQFLNNRYYNAIQKGVMIATFFYCTMWVLYFASSLFIN